MNFIWVPLLAVFGAVVSFESTQEHYSAASRE